ncbi:hypothetical protein CHS0354_014873 [Potamilus streckersoni]|uniref:Uncharacterized protein n=1 Tax=Potamilus streckersoni TaxID=2493646 RepID=A0AAE0TJ07_9BIVA|nr:hypothetical protein CHS0354_014873 [Potamilus streckersoni]
MHSLLFERNYILHYEYGPQVAKWSKAFTIMGHCHPTSVCMGWSLWPGQYSYLRKLARIFSWVCGYFWVLPGSSSTIDIGHHI